MTTYNTFTDGAYTQTPLLLLVDGNTASASEVLSSALQDNGRAKLAGTQTFGKAVIQAVEELDDGSAVVVTIAQYQTPKKTNINKKGIEVDLPRPDCPLGAEAVGTCVTRRSQGARQGDDDIGYWTLCALLLPGPSERAM